MGGFVRFLLKRLTNIVLVSLGIVFFAFLAMRMSYNSYAPKPDYNIPRHVRYALRDSIHYLEGAVKGDLGVAQERKRTVPVSQILADTYPKSLGLIAISLFGAAALGVVMGTWAAAARRASLGLITASVLGISVPSFFAAFLLQRGVIYVTQHFNVRLVPVGGFGWDKHLVLPALVLAARPLAQVTRISFITLDEVLRQDYIRTALAKGLSWGEMLWGHALRNAAIPILTSMGISLRLALGSLPVIEYFFGWPGLGRKLIEAIRAGQSELVVTLALALGVTLMLVNLLLDVLYRIVDPRLREES